MENWVSFRDRSAAISTAIVSTASFLDWWSHHPYNQANLVHREIISTLPLIGEFLSKSIGNAHYSAAIVLSLAIPAEIIRQIGINTESRYLQNFANSAELLALVTALFVNFVTELAYYDPLEFTPDLAVGFSVSILSLIAAKWGADRIRNKFYN